MNKEYFAKKLIQLFPEYKVEYQKHLEDYGEILGHVFFSDMINLTLFNLLKLNQDTELIQKYIGFIEEMYASGDNDVKNVVEVTILEYLGDDDTVLKNAFSYFSEDMIQASKIAEANLGRRSIHIWRRRGKVFSDWKESAHDNKEYLIQKGIPERGD